MRALSRLLALTLMLALGGSPALAQLVQYRAADNLNNVPVSQLTPLPTLGVSDADVIGSGTLPAATLNATFTIPLSNRRSTVGIRVSGLTGSGATITSEGTSDGGVTWTNANTTASSGTSSLSATLTTDDQFRVGVAGRTAIRLRVSTVGTGTISVAYSATAATGGVFLTSSLPQTNGVIGGVNNQQIAGTTISVGAGTSDAGTQRVAANVAAGADAAEGNVTDTAYAGAGSTTVIGGLKGIYASLIAGTANEQAVSGIIPASANLSPSVTDFGATSTAYTSYNVSALSTTAATLLVFYSTDNATFVQMDNRTMTANTPITVTYPIMARYAFVQILNGATAQSTASKIAVSTSIGK